MSFELASAPTRGRAGLCSSLNLDVTCWKERGWNQREGAEEGDSKARANRTPPRRRLPSQAKPKRGVAPQKTSKGKKAWENGRGRLRGGRSGCAPRGLINGSPWSTPWAHRCQWLLPRCLSQHEKFLVSSSWEVSPLWLVRHESLCFLPSSTHNIYTHFFYLKSIGSSSIGYTWLAAPILPKPRANLVSRQWTTSLPSPIVLVWASGLQFSTLKGMPEMLPSKLSPQMWVVWTTSYAFNQFRPKKGKDTGFSLFPGMCPAFLAHLQSLCYKHHKRWKGGAVVLPSCSGVSDVSVGTRQSRHLSSDLGHSASRSVIWPSSPLTVG